jgi:hypothetical protein
MKVEEIAEAVGKLPPEQLARFRRWFAAFEAKRTNHAEELDAATISESDYRRPCDGVTQRVAMPECGVTRYQRRRDR